MDVDRYARQRLIQGWSQERLQRAKVLVAGAGALGNEVLKNLALLGVGSLVVVDFDHIEVSNLSRTVLFGAADVGRGKAEAAAHAINVLNPEITVHALAGDLVYDVGLGFYRHCNLVIGCLDNLAARSQVGLSCTLAGVPYLDGGMWSMGGEVRWFTAGEGPCFDCTLDDDDWQRVFERRSCTGFAAVNSLPNGLLPTMATTASIIGGLQAQEALKWLNGHPVPLGKAIVYNGQALTMHRSELVRNPSCSASHEPYQDVVELPLGNATATAQQLFRLTRAAWAGRDTDATGRADAQVRPVSLSSDVKLVLELGRDFLLDLVCVNCGRTEEIHLPWGRVLESRRTCPHCGAFRRPDVVSVIEEGGPHADTPLSQLGVPSGEVLAVRSADRLVLYELTADIALA